MPLVVCRIVAGDLPHGDRAGGGVGVRLLDGGRRSGRHHRLPDAPHRCAGVVLGRRRPSRRAAAARHRVGRDAPSRPAARQGPRPVGRARLRRADGAVDGVQRDLRRGPRRSRRRPRPGVRHAVAGGGRPGVVRHGGATRRAGRVHPGRCRPRRRRAVRWAGAPRRGAGRRWRRWGEALGPLDLPDAYAHTGLRAPFAFPDGEVVDLVLTPDGWRSRAPAAPGAPA